MRIHQLVEGINIPGRARPREVSSLIRRMRALGVNVELANPTWRSDRNQNYKSYYIVSLSNKPDAFLQAVAMLEEGGYTPVYGDGCYCRRYGDMWHDLPMVSLERNVRNSYGVSIVYTKDTPYDDVTNNCVSEFRLSHLNLGLPPA